MPGWSMLTVRGQVALGGKPRLVFAAVENPTVMFVNAFREALSRKGIFVGGSALDIDDVRTAPDLAKAETWVTDQSPPLFEIVDPLLKRSRNGYAETLLWTLSPPGEPASEVAGLKVLRETLTELGVDPALYASFDGSGLSRYDMLTAESLMRVLTTIWNDPVMLGPYRSALPVAGTAGSIENRLKGTPAAGRVWAKTGSMFNIDTLSGYVLTADDEPLAFSFLANNYTVPSSEIDAMYGRGAGSGLPRSPALTPPARRAAGPARSAHGIATLIPVIAVPTSTTTSAEGSPAPFAFTPRTRTKYRPGWNVTRPRRNVAAPPVSNTARLLCSGRRTRFDPVVSRQPAGPSTQKHDATPVHDSALNPAGADGRGISTRSSGLRRTGSSSDAMIVSVRVSTMFSRLR